ncbi:MAG: DUF1232 domain-containing protein [Alcanivorax sp.]|nr:DUF1232 domain-containing protein [Alcanivorax sp.]
MVNKGDPGGDDTMTSAKTLLLNAIKRIREDTLTVYFAARDRRTPGLVRLLAVAVAAYALSPIDLIPDFIPLLGLLDDALLLPLAIMLILRLTPAAVIADSRVRAAALVHKPVSRPAAVVIMMLWLLAVVGLAYGLWPASQT